MRCTHQRARNLKETLSERDGEYGAVGESRSRFGVFVDLFTHTCTHIGSLMWLNTSSKVGGLFSWLM